VPPITAPQELSRLSRVFNTMLDSIERLITQVYEARLREKDAQLLALQSQINPHFLFNTLNSMRALSRRGDAAGVAAVAESLADLFRYSMSNWNELVPLREELAHVASYMTIQRARFGDRVQYACAVPDELAGALVVKLSLQPLVENAIAHGLGRNGDQLHVTVDAVAEGEGLAVTVADDGGGIELATLARLREAVARPVAVGKLPTAEVGIGVTNIDRRIKLLFGEQYGLRFQVIPGAGTTVALHLPLQSRDGIYELEAHSREDPRGGG
jgi:two-component system, sensor histidine kinase YesM